MARTMNPTRISLFGVLSFLMWAMATTASAQNVIVNGDFEDYNIYGAITAPSSTDYTRVNANYVVEYGHYVINTTTSGHGGGQGWPNPSNSHGKYMIVNGFGGSSNPTKVVWRQTVNVTAQTNYTLSYRYVNLNRVIYGQINPAKLQVKINGTNFGGVNSLPSNNDWHDWNNNGTKWNSGNATQAVIEIYDTYTGNEGLGDDFCLDDISFVPDETYSVTANNDTWPLACIWTPVEIPVLDNDIISPGIQTASVQILQQPLHGEATVLSNKKIEYIFNDATFSGTDQLKYRVGFNNQGIYDEAWVFITVGQAPVVANISAPGPICAGGALGIQTPSVNPSATGHWEYGSSQNGPFQTLNDPTNIPLSMNGKWVRYSASNDCGEGHSNAVQITVTNGPTFSGQTPQIQPICAGQSLTLTAPAYNANGSQILSQGWVASPTENGDYNAFSLNNIPATYNGWYIRYMIEGSCGFVYSSPARLLTVNVAPDVTGTLQAPEAICAGDNLNVTPPTYDGNGTGAWEICQNQTGNYQSFSIQNVPVTYNNWYLHYKVSNDCGSDVSNAVQIHVYDEPTIATPTPPDAICAGSSFTLNTPAIQNNGSTITDQGWQIAATQNGTYSPFNNNNVPYTYNQYWIRYFAVNDCGETYSTPVQITVNDEPLVGAITAPAGICAGQSFALTAPQVTWRDNNPNTHFEGWEIQINGTWQPLPNNNIPFAYNGCNIRYKAVNGCGTAYSTNNVQVTVYSTDPIDEGEITACDVIYHHGVLCDQNGVYVADSITPNNCTIQVSWNFTLSEAYTETQSFTACEMFTWPKNGQTYYASCTDTYTYDSSDPLICDSIYTLILTINNAPTISDNLQAPADVCSGSPLMVTTPPYQMNHTEGGTQRWEYATSPNGPFHPFDPATYHLDYGSYYLRFVVINECDSTFSNTVPFNVNDTPVIEGQLSAFQVCENNPLDLPEVDVEWRNTDVNDRISEWQMANAQNGTYTGINPEMLMQMSHNGCWIRFYAHNSCGNDILGPVPITVLSAEDQWLETITACDAYQLPSGEMITETQVVEYEEFEPCFHVIHQPVVINYSNYVVEPITSCHEEHEWHGRIFHRMEQTQYAWDTLTNVNGCDSIVELNLNFDEYSSFTHNRVACGSYVWEMNPGHVYYETQRDSVFVPAVTPEDCDTWYYLELTLGHDTLIDGGGMIECSGFEWHGVPYYVDAILYDSLQTNVTHCDSIIFYNLTIIPPLSGEESVVSCQPMWWHEHYCVAEGDYQHTFVSSQGCDSIVTLHFSLAPEIVMPPADTLVCEPFTWNGHYFNENGQASYTFQTPSGCDSTVFLNVTFVQAETLPDEPVRACNSYTFHGVTYGPGIYEIPHDTVFAQNGCISSIQLLNLTVKDSEQMGTISGNTSVYVASSLISGVYRYEIDMEGLSGQVTWSLSNSDWQIVETGIDFCRVLVTTPVTAFLTAHFNVEDCGEMERSFEINATFYGVDDWQDEVRVFPNPTRGTVTIEAEGMESIRLTNMMGQVLEKREGLRSDSIILNLNGYTPSVYLLEIETAYGMVKKRLVLCR